jgi:glycosyltransferase involved in cell wall biosynthesis
MRVLNEENFIVPKSRVSQSKRLSIVTISYNVREGLSATALSLPDTLPSWCEWVVVDGGSKDGTPEFLSALGPKLSRFISEKDNGIADAFNKGVRLSKGHYVMFLNAGDCLAPGFFDVVYPLLQEGTAPAIIGRIRMTGKSHGKPVSFSRQWMRNHLPHQAMLIRRGLFRLLGPYDEKYRLGMDFEWSLRLKPFWPQIKFIPDVLSDMEPGGVSMTQYRDTYDQYHLARQKHCGLRLLSRLVSEFFKAKVWLGRKVRGL